MGAFSNLFKIGDRQLPRVSILEAFAENPDDQLSAPDVIRITQVSRRAVYLILNDLVKEGILVKLPTEKRSRAQTYMLNPNDVRAANLSLIESLLTTGSLEARIKEMTGVPSSVMAPMSIMSPRTTAGAGQTCCDWSFEQNRGGCSVEESEISISNPVEAIRPATASSMLNGRSGWRSSNDPDMLREDC